MQTKCTIGQLSDGDGHGLLLAESEEAFICFPAGKHTQSFGSESHCVLQNMNRKYVSYESMSFSGR